MTTSTFLAGNLPTQRHHYRLARHPSRIDAKREDLFLQANLSVQISRERGSDYFDSQQCANCATEHFFSETLTSTFR